MTTWFRGSEPTEEVKLMTTEPKRLTFAATPDVEAIMDRARRILYNKNQSEVIRILISAGLAAINDEKAEKEPASHI